MKSILIDFRRSKTAITTILKASKFDFWKYFALKNVKNSQNSKFRAAQIVKMAVFGLQNDQIRSRVKSEWHKNPEISTLGIPN